MKIVMGKCSNCLNLQTTDFHWCEKVNDSPDINIERNCIHYKEITNADFVRRMKNEDLAEILMCPNETNLVHIECEHKTIADANCYNCLLKWLEQKKQ